MHTLFKDDGIKQLRVASICVSAIAPTLTLFDVSDSSKAYALLYSSLAGLDDDSLSQFDLEVTKRRMEIFREVAAREHLINPCVSDLVGYLNWRLTGSLTINSISLAESGLTPSQATQEVLAIISRFAPHVVAPSEYVGLTTQSASIELGIAPGIPVCGGCPDTLGSVMGSGVRKSSESMLYLGTFGSLLRLDRDVEDLLNEVNVLAPPFQWLLSVPDLGPTIEKMSRDFVGPSDAIHCLSGLDNTAVEASPGAGGTCFLVPRWKNGMIQVGAFELMADRAGVFGDGSRRSRAILEGIAYAVLAIGGYGGGPLFASGGGTRSRKWLDIISEVLGCHIYVQDMAWESSGTADIAARLVWPKEDILRPVYSSFANNNTDRAIIDDNLQRIMEQYREQEWL